MTTIAVSQIQNELTRIWDSLQGTKKMRACLFNLLVFAPQTERLEYIRTLAQKVVERFPCRILFITVDSTRTTDELDAHASILFGAKGEFDIVCDFIEFKATRISQERIPFVILPHILPDLPVYLLWADDPVQKSPLSTHLEELSTRMIFDAETTTNLPSFATTLLSYTEQTPAEIGDLTWARTENWRELLSSTFHAEEQLEQLRHIKELHLTYNDPSHPLQALYLQGWLASQLNWKLEKHTPSLLTYTTHTVSLHAESRPDLSPGAILSCILLTHNGENFSFKRSLQNPHHVEIVFSNREKCTLPAKYIFTKSQTGLSLVKEICQGGNSPHYLKLLTYLKNLC